jgi:hypothetical protein
MLASSSLKTGEYIHPRRRFIETCMDISIALIEYASGCFKTRAAQAEPKKIVMVLPPSLP